MTRYAIMDPGELKTILGFPDSTDNEEAFAVVQAHLGETAIALLKGGGHSSG